MQRVSYIIFYFFALAIMLIPQFIRKRIFNGLALLAYWLDKKHRKIVRINLDLAFKETMSDAEKTAIAKSCFKNLISEVVSVIEVYFYPVKRYHKQIEIQGREYVDEAHRKGQPIVFFSNHYNNLEIGGIGLAMVSPTLHVVQQTNNRYLDAFMARSRERNGLKTIFMGKALRYLSKQLKNGGDISLIVDQSVKKDVGIIVDFFGQPTMHLTSASFLARKFDAALIPISLSVKEDGSYLTSFYPPVPFSKTDDVEEDIRYLTQAQATFLEGEIRKDPKAWFWCHKRWKTSIPGIYQ